MWVALCGVGGFWTVSRDVVGQMLIGVRSLIENNELNFKDMVWNGAANMVCNPPLGYWNDWILHSVSGLFYT